MTTIRVAMAQDSPPINIPVWIAQQEGFFKKRGLNVQAATPNIPFSSQLATLGHQYDLVVTSQPDLVRAVASGIHDVALFGAELDVPQDPAAGLVMSPKSGVTSIKQLAGHSVGAPSVTGNNWGAFECWLEKNGVKPSAVRGVQVAPPELPDLISAGRVDGGLIFNPILTNLIAKGNKSLGDPYKGCFGNGEQNGYFTATSSWANANKQALAKFLAAEKEAVAFIAGHMPVARAAYVKLSGLPAKVAAQAVIYPPEMNFKISTGDFATWEKIMKSIGQLPPNAPDPSKLVLPLPSAS
jgi:NitT/TauT family transport system substrate-binding protein